MKNKIFEYIEPTTAEKAELWNNAVFVFDTNALLNLYRYSKNTRNEVISALEENKEKIWIPYQVAYEFMKNRCDVINEGHSRYKKVEELSQKFLIDIRNLLKKTSEDQDMQKLHELIFDWIRNEENDEEIILSVSDDPILDKVLELFAGKTGTSFSKERLTEIKTEGKTRYENNIPPGYKDYKKTAEVGQEANIYGDLILWKEIIAYAKDNQKNIILVTNDQKEDWWNISKGKTIGPRPELRKEFCETTKQKFHMYTMEGFLKYNKDKSGKEIETSVLNELNRVERNSSSEEMDSLSEVTKEKINISEMLLELKYINDRLEQIKADPSKKKAPLMHRLVSRKHMLEAYLSKMTQDAKNDERLEYEISNKYPYHYYYYYKDYDKDNKDDKDE